MQHFGRMNGFGDAASLDGLSDEQEGELFFTNYVAEGYYTATDGPTMIANIQNNTIPGGQTAIGSYLTNVGSSIRVGQLTADDLKSVRKSVYADSNTYLDRLMGNSTSVFPDLSIVLADIAAQPSSFVAVAAVAAAATVKQVTDVVDDASDVLGLGLGAYTIYLVGGAVVAGYVLIKHLIPSGGLTANPRRSSKRRKTARKKRRA